MDLTGPNLIKIDLMDQMGPNWTDMDRTGLN